METERQKTQAPDFKISELFKYAAGGSAILSGALVGAATFGNRALETVGEAGKVMTGMQAYVNDETFRIISEGVSQNLMYAGIAGGFAALNYMAGKACEKRNL